MSEPDMSEPDMSEPDTGEPDTGEPDTGEPDMSVVHALCELQVAARRLGCTIRVHEARPELVELIVLAGLEEILLWGPDQARPRARKEQA